MLCQATRLCFLSCVEQKCWYK